MFTLQIQCPTLDDAERIIAALKHSANPAVVDALAAQIPADADGFRRNMQFATEIADLVKVDPYSGAILTGAGTPEPKKRGRPRRAVAEKPAASTEPPVKTDADLAKQVNEPEAQQAPTLDDARAALKGVQAKYGTDDMTKPLEVLGQFSAGRISEVKPEQYPAFIAACKAA